MGIRAEVMIDTPASCPVARVSAATGATCSDVSMTAVGDGGTVTEEFQVDANGPVGGADAAVELDEVFSYGSKQTYRFTRPVGVCPCERIELVDCPLTDVHAREGDLYVAFHASDMEQLKDALAGLREVVEGVRVRRLLHSNADDVETDLVLLDRSVLTARQREVLEVAHELGFFEHGRGANAGQVAEALGINTSTFSEHLRAAQRKLLRTILEP